MDQNLQWVCKMDAPFTTSLLMLAQAKMRKNTLDALSTWTGGTTCVFGGSVRKAILSEFTIQNNKELQYRLADGTFRECVLSPDHFTPLDTDLDIYITEPVNRATTCLQGLQTHLQHVLHDYVVVLVPHDATGTRLWIKTHPHPIAQTIKIQLDLVLNGTSSLFPDFACNQLCLLTTATSVLDVFNPSNMFPPWWTSVPVMQKCLSSSFAPFSLSILGGAQDTRRRTIDTIKDQIQKKMTHVLVFSFSRWAWERHRLHQRVDRTTYSAYVGRIVCTRLLKVLNDGFHVEGFQPQITAEQTFVCKGGHSTQICSVQIQSTAHPEVVLRPGELGEEGGEDVEDGKHVKPYYWCVGCSLWHEIMEILV